MNNMLEKYYDICIDKIYKNKSGYFFFYDNTKYYILIKNESLLLKYNCISKENLDYSRYFNWIVRNKYKELSTNYLGKQYILIKVNCIEKMKATIFDIISYSKIIIDIKELTINNYEDKISKIDVLERKIVNYDFNNNKLCKIIDFYIGLAENSISYMSNNMKNDLVVFKSLSHITLKCFTLEELFDVSNISNDYWMSDIIKYMNYLLLIGENWEETLDDFLKNTQLNENEYIILYSGIVYPYYFFVIIENMNNSIENHIIEKISDIDNLIKNIDICYKKITKYCKIEKIKWINNN